MTRLPSDRCVRLPAQRTLFIIFLNAVVVFDAAQAAASKPRGGIAVVQPDLFRSVSAR